MTATLTDKQTCFERPGGQASPEGFVLLRGMAYGARRARAEVGEIITAWGADRETTDTVIMVVSELVTNAIRHAGGALGLAVRRTGDGITVLVTDGRPHVSVVRLPACDTGECGRGIRLLESVSEDFGWQAHDGHKVVWACVRVARWAR